VKTLLNVFPTKSLVKLELLTLFSCVSGHCKKLAPEYESAAKTLAEKDPPRYVAKVDATKHEALAKRFSIQGFPTLKWFVNG